MADKKFFRKEVSTAKDKKADEYQDEFVTWGAAWLGELKDSDLPFLSVRISEKDFAGMKEAAEKSEDGSIRAMMFPNRNPREGHVDPDYYIVPPKERV